MGQPLIRQKVGEGRDMGRFSGALEIGKFALHLQEGATGDQ
jgi:hypothetical protein